MYRPMILSLAVTTLAQFALPGCPPTAGPDAEVGVPPRVSIETTAQSDTELAAPGQSVALSATADTARGAVSFSWVQSRGPGVSIADADRADAGFVAASLAEEKTLTFIVTTRNERGDVGRAETSVIVAADPDFDSGSSGSSGSGGSGGGSADGPTARAGGDRTVDPDSVVTLDGSASTGSGLSYSWTQVSGKPQLELSLADTARPIFIAPPFVGTSNAFRFELTVRDDRQQSSRDSVTVRIRAPDSFTGSQPDGKTRVRFETTRGDFVIELEDVLVPKTVANFLRYVNDGFYEGLIFHRVIPDFVVQGGGFTPLMAPAETRDPIALELNTSLKNKRGTVGMARLSAPDSATSQFYVNLKDNDDLDPTEGFSGFAVFGHVVSGMDVIDGIAGVRTAARGFGADRFEDVPVVDIIINSASVE